jgi:hypothetical protein
VEPFAQQMGSDAEHTSPPQAMWKPPAPQAPDEPSFAFASVEDGPESSGSPLLPLLLVFDLPLLPASSRGVPPELELASVPVEDDEQA